MIKEKNKSNLFFVVLCKRDMYIAKKQLILMMTHYSSGTSNNLFLLFQPFWTNLNNTWRSLHIDI
jgi:hypothetical protein